MRMRLLLLIITAITIVSCNGARKSETYRVLEDVDSYIEARPDSALAVLEGIDKSELTSKELEAKYALLLSQALDKNYIDVTDDSLASVALDYYSRKGPKKYEARSLYYLGLSHYYAGDYDKAILETTKAEEVAVGNDSLYLGFVKVLQADIYSKTHNDVEVLNSLQQAYDIYTQLSLSYYINVAQLRISKALYNSGCASRADSLLCFLTTNEYVDRKIKAYALTDRAFIKTVDSIPDYALATSMYENVLKDYGPEFMTLKDYWAYFFSLEKIGRSG